MTRGAKARQVAQAARQRLVEQQRRERRRQTAWVSAVAVAALLLIGVGGAAVWQATRPDVSELPAGVTDDGAGLAVGTGPVTVEIYLDLLCPACRQFDAAARPVLDEYLANDTVTLVYRPIAILDDRTTTKFSTRAASAAGCAADADALDGFIAAMMENQPTEGSAGLSDDEIIQIGESAGATDPAFAPCVREGSYRAWVGRSTDDAFDRGVQGTPTVFVDGSLLEQRGPTELAAAIDNAAAAAG